MKKFSEANINLLEVCRCLALALLFATSKFCFSFAQKHFKKSKIFFLNVICLNRNTVKAVLWQHFEKVFSEILSGSLKLASWLVFAGPVSL